MRRGCTPPGKKFQQNLKGGTKVKFTPPPLDFLRNSRENLKGETKGYFDLSREKS
jgi:hypothetical protein